MPTIDFSTVLIIILISFIIGLFVGANLAKQSSR
jgi:hypothetical protein